MTESIHVSRRRKSSFFMLDTALDDANLDPYSFRVYARICRRAGEGVCFESVDAMVSACQMGRTKFYDCLAELERIKFIERVPAENGRIHFVVTDCSEWDLDEHPVRHADKGCPPRGQGVSATRTTPTIIGSNKIPLNRSSKKEDIHAQKIPEPKTASEDEQSSPPLTAINEPIPKQKAEPYKSPTAKELVLTHATVPNRIENADTAKKNNARPPTPLYELVEHWGQEFGKRYNTDPLKPSPKDFKQAKYILDKVPSLEEAKGLVTHFMHRKDAWYIKRGHTLQTLVGEIDRLWAEFKNNRIISSHQGRDAELREHNRQAVQQVEEMQAQGVPSALQQFENQIEQFSKEWNDARNAKLSQPSQAALRSPSSPPGNKR